MAYLKINSHVMEYCSTRIDRNWQLVASGPASYSATRRKLAIICVGIGAPNGETYTPPLTEKSGLPTPRQKPNEL